MDSNSLLTKLEESQTLLHEVLYDANVVSDVLEQAELRVSDANAKYAALRRFVCSALMAELKRQVRLLHYIQTAAHPLTPRFQG